MRYADYFRGQIFCIVTHVCSMVGCAIFLSAVGIDRGIIAILITVWFFIAAVYLNVRFYFRNRYFKEILSQLDRLDQKYLIAEVMEVPARPEDRIYYDILKAANKSMLEEISQTRREQKEYKEYIERWIHDVKTPIAAMRLICENNRSDPTRRLLAELEKVGHFTEQALYYARSETVEKDYFIREILLSDVVHAAIAENKQLLMQNHVSIRIENCESAVYADEKWVGFILNQLVSNAVKYGGEHPALRFEGAPENNRVILSVKDNGIGISESDLPRIFEKGFTGENGRKDKVSTGIGLYLCKRLCDRLGIGIAAESKIGSGTAVTLSFPKGDYGKAEE